MKTIRFSVLFVAMAAIVSVSAAQAGGPGGCPPWRPCGPGNSFGGNRMVHQQFYGADMRHVCAAHDACLASGVPRAQCDRQFLNNMNCACENSRHPIHCKMKAFEYYAAARLFGGFYY